MGLEQLLLPGIPKSMLEGLKRLIESGDMRGDLYNLSYKYLGGKKIVLQHRQTNLGVTKFQTTSRKLQFTQNFPITVVSQDTVCFLNIMKI